MQAKWIKLDLVPTRCESDNAQYGPSNYSKINELIAGLKRESFTAQYDLIKTQQLHNA